MLKKKKKVEPLKIEHKNGACDCGKDFYKYFKMGIELEGSFYTDCLEYYDEEEDCYCEVGSYWGAKTDQSVEHLSGATSQELITERLLTDDRGEKAIIEDLKNTLVTKKDGGQERFAMPNPSAGTHIHFSFKLENNDIFDILGLAEMNKREKLDSWTAQNMLRIFDRVEFEKYFFKEYIKEFSLAKYHIRLSGNSSYCKSNGVKAFERGEDREGRYYHKCKSYKPVLLDSVKLKTEEDRYLWLNVNSSLDQNKGIELRIYPYLTTFQGLQEVLNFTKRVVTHYFKRSETQKALKYLRQYICDYSLERGNEIEIKELDELQKVIAEGLMIKSDERRRPLNGDLMVMLSKWIAKNPKVIKRSKPKREEEKEPITAYRPLVELYADSD